SWPVCTRNGLPVCGETCVGGTCNTPGCTC
nr:kalata B1 [validated] - Oldenlandia affinis [Oldenlandia affinis]1KAL_A Chain A, KALATA B1 [Oldenlandia affinis]